ncbi:hypothetical protein ASD19_07335 [Microbacterium sp. Root53]|nr:hypothetical protein ASD19_07335 [Microbacterium sp. Root53]
MLGRGVLDGLRVGAGLRRGIGARRLVARRSGLAAARRRVATRGRADARDVVLARALDVGARGALDAHAVHRPRVGALASGGHRARGAAARALLGLGGVRRPSVGRVRGVHALLEAAAAGRIRGGELIRIRAEVVGGVRRGVDVVALVDHVIRARCEARLAVGRGGQHGPAEGLVLVDDRGADLVRPLRHVLPGQIALALLAELRVEGVGALGVGLVVVRAHVRLLLVDGMGSSPSSAAVGAH